MNWVDKAVESANGKARLAKELGVTVQAVLFWEAGARTPDPATSSLLFTRFGIPRWETRPKDWHDIWPELVNQPGAPKVVTPA